MHTANHSILSDIAAQAMKEFDQQTAASDRCIADMYQDGFHTLGEVARAMGTTRTGVMLALYRLNLLPGQQH